MIPSKHVHFLLALAIPALVAAGTPPGAKGSAKAEAAQQATATMGNQASYGVKLGGFFTEEQKKTARAYFSKRYAKGKECPPGMERAAKDKACAPPVEGRYWAVGQSLQPAVKTYPVPEPALAKLPQAPEGYEYVMAGEDILLVSRKIHLVVDMIEDVMG